MKAQKTSLFSLPTAILASALIAAPLATVSASDVIYDYAEFRYESVEIDDADGDGFKFGGSYQLKQSPEFYLIGSYSSYSADDFDADFTVLDLGAGYIHPLNPDWDGNVSLSFVKAEADGRDVFDDSETGFHIRGGARGMINPQVEARAILNFVDVYDSDTYITLGGDYFITSNISGGVELDIGGDTDRISFGGRYYF